MRRTREELEEARAVAARLRSGLPVSDARFDRLLGPDLRPLAGLHFTPVEVAAQAAAWLTAGGAAEVVDLGAGAGKFCLVGAAVTGARFTGLERRGALVAFASALARDMGLPEAGFVEADFLTLPLDRFQAFYAFNPFGEAGDGLDADERLDPGAPVPDREAAVAALTAGLARARPGARLAVYCGLGGPPPAGWRLVANERAEAHGGLLELFER